MKSPTSAASLASRALRHKSFVVGATLTLLLAGAALLSLLWTPYPPADIDIPAKLQNPSAAHWLGTDSLGRDITSQLLVGAQNSIVVGLIAVGIGLITGVALGCLASASRASGRGWVEELIMRASDFTFAFPALLSAIMLTAVYGPGLVMSIVAIGIFNIPVFARITSMTAERVTRARIAACTRASATAGRMSALKASHRPPPSSSVQPGKPPALTHCNCTANTRMSRIANQKLGIAIPNWLAAITPTSPRRLWRDAAYTPRPRASAAVSVIAISASGRVTRRRSLMSSAVGVS